MNMKVCFTYLGPLQYRGRLFKQIQTLRNAGFKCVLIHGQTETKAPDYSLYDFPILPIRVIQEKIKFLTLASQLNFAQKAAQKIKTVGADTVVCVNLQSALSGAIAKKSNPGLRFIFDNNELSLEMFTNPLKRNVWFFIQNIILKRVDVIIHAERRRMEYFHNVYNTEARNFVLQNLPFFREEVPAPRDRSKPIRCVYVGSFMPDRYCAEMLNGFSQMNGLEVTFDMAGFYGRAGYERIIKSQLEAIETKRIRILPPVPHSEMYHFLSYYDIGLAFYQNTNLNNYYCAPNKVYDYIQMGMPVITNDYPGLLDEVQKNALGVCISNVDMPHLRDAIQTIIEKKIYANITDSVRKRFSWENQEIGYIKLFQ